MSILSDYQKHVEQPRMEADAIQIKALRERLAAMTDERNNLLSALRAAHNEIHARIPDSNVKTLVWDAIAKAEGRS